MAIDRYTLLYAPEQPEVIYIIDFGTNRNIVIEVDGLKSEYYETPSKQRFDIEDIKFTSSTKARVSIETKDVISDFRSEIAKQYAVIDSPVEPEHIFWAAINYQDLDKDLIKKVFRS